jgi:hypothetical protein
MLLNSNSLLLLNRIVLGLAPHVVVVSVSQRQCEISVIVKESVAKTATQSRKSLSSLCGLIDLSVNMAPCSSISNSLLRHLVNNQVEVV